MDLAVRGHNLCGVVWYRTLRVKVWNVGHLIISLLFPLCDQCCDALGPVLWRPATVKWRQSSQSNRHSTIGTRQTEYHEVLPSSANVSHTSLRRSPTMVTLYDTRFVECRWWNDGWTVKTVVTWRSPASMIPAPGLRLFRKFLDPLSTCALASCRSAVMSDVFASLSARL